MLFMCDHQILVEVFFSKKIIDESIAGSLQGTKSLRNTAFKLNRLLQPKSCKSNSRLLRSVLQYGPFEGPLGKFKHLIVFSSSCCIWKNFFASRYRRYHWTPSVVSSFKWVSRNMFPKWHCFCFWFILL